MNKRIQMIAQSGKSNHDGNLIGRPLGLFLFQTDIDQKGSHNQYVNRIDPRIGGMSREPEKEAISMIYKNKQA
jgi:hypothetical protein